jgi:hypothetical protein
MTSVTTIIGGASTNQNASFSTSGSATVYGGNGNDSVSVGGGWVNLGNGNDHVTVGAGGGAVVLGSGNDTVNLATGNYTVSAQNYATVIGANGSGATIHGGLLNVSGLQEYAISGNQTLLGGAGSKLIGANLGASTTFIGTTTGSDTMTGGLLGNSLFEILQKGGTHTINWTPGNNQLFVENLNWAQLQPDISYSGGNTLITLDGGATKIIIVGHHLTSGDIKP